MSQLELHQRLRFKLKRLHYKSAILCSSATAISGKAVVQSKIVCVRLEDTSPRKRAVTDTITSIALIDTAFSHMLNAEGEMMQRVLEIQRDNTDATAFNDINALNKSVTKVVKAVTKTQMVLSESLNIVYSFTD